MIADFEKIQELMKELNAALKKKTSLFMIGGGMLLYHGLKTATKDIDIIAKNQEEFNAVEHAFKSIGFQSRFPSLEYKNMALSQILLREDFRIDLFHKTVCSGFFLSDGMMKRATEALKLDKLTLYLCSIEDVFLFKTLTEREGDLEDCLALAKRGIDWNAILNELHHQIKASGREVWITYVGERLDILEDRGLVIPILPEVTRLREEYFKDYEKRMKDIKDE